MHFLVIVHSGNVTLEVLIAMVPGEVVVHVGHGVGIRARVGGCERLCVGRSEELGAVAAYSVQQSIMLIMPITANLIEPSTYKNYHYTFQKEISEYCAILNLDMFKLLPHGSSIFTVTLRKVANCLSQRIRVPFLVVESTACKTQVSRLFVICEKELKSYPSFSHAAIAPTADG